MYFKKIIKCFNSLKTPPKSCKPIKRHMINVKANFFMCYDKGDKYLKLENTTMTKL